MLNQKCFCLPLWVWLVAIGIAVYYYCYARPENKPKPVEEKKEKFANVANTKLKIFNFNTDWCGWSKRFQPEWDKFTQAVKADSKLNNKVEVFDVKCDNPANQQARYRQKTSSILGDAPAFTPISNNMNNSAIIDNYSSSLKQNSSGDRLNKMNHIERMF